MNFKILLKNSLKTLTAVVLVFIFAHVVGAASPSSILVSVMPPNPAPFADVTISLNSYANNLDTILITWTVDGKTALSGIGRKSFAMKAPAAGSKNIVMAKVSLPDGDVETSIIISPANITLLWQANDSYVPPFYRGKAMPSPGSDVKVVAIPEVKASSGGMVPPQNMTYAWKKDYTNDQAASGYGKDFYIYTNDFLEGTNHINVTASTIDGQNSSEANISVGATDPKILFYREDAGLGTLWESMLGDPQRINGNAVLVAVPYFISPKNIQTPTLTFSWSINGTPVSSVAGFRKNVIPLKVQSGTSGNSKIRLDIGNQYKIFQNVSKEINIQF